MPPTNKGRDLEREVFGGSESELSSDEDEEQQQQQQQQRPLPPPAQPEDDQESSAGPDSEDDYVQQARLPSSSSAAVVGKATKKKTRKKRATVDAGAVGDEREPSKIAKKRKRRQPVEVDLSGLPPEQANKIRLDMKIDEILKSKKSNRPRKKKTTDEVLDSFADDEVARLRETMSNAADEDLRSNQDKLPAMSKLRMLPEAMDTLRKASLAQSMIDNNLLEAVRRWLEPLPDRSLPALNIQREFFNSIRKMEFIDSAVLKESGLGRIVLFYTKCKRVTPDIARLANDLVSMWSRPIIKRSASYRDRIVPVAETDLPGPGGTGTRAGMVDMRAGEKLSAILARAKEEEERKGQKKVRKNAVSIPQRELGTYTVAPTDRMGLMVGMRTNASVEMDVERRKKNAERLRSLTRKVNVK